MDSMDIIVAVAVAVAGGRRRREDVACRLD